MTRTARSWSPDSTLPCHWRATLISRRCERYRTDQVSDQVKAHISPAHFEAINPYGTLIFDIAGVLKRSRRPLRRL